MSWEATLLFVNENASVMLSCKLNCSFSRNKCLACLLTRATLCHEKLVKMFPNSGCALDSIYL